MAELLCRVRTAASEDRRRRARLPQRLRQAPQADIVWYEHGSSPRVRGLEERFTNRILPLFARRTQEDSTHLPELYLHGLSK